MGPDLQPAQPVNSQQGYEPASILATSSSGGRMSLPVGIKVKTWEVDETHKGPRTPSTPSVYSRSTPSTKGRRSGKVARDLEQPSSSNMVPGWGMGPMAGQQFWQQPPWYPSYWMPPPWQYPGPVVAPQQQASVMQYPLPAWLVVHFSS